MKNLPDQEEMKKKRRLRRKKRSRAKKKRGNLSASGKNLAAGNHQKEGLEISETARVIPKEALNILNRLEDAGYEAWCVGGCVRDTLLGHTPRDWDVTTSATPDEMRVVFGKRAIPTGLKHGTMTIRSGATGGIEVTTYRVDGDYTDHRRPDSVTFTDSLRRDLQRRDFTVNAIAINQRGEIRDPYHGQDDLNAGILRCVEDPDRRFNEDALRILRGLRFAAVLSRPKENQAAFEIEPETAAAMRRNRDLLSEIAPERIWMEFSKLIRGEYAVPVLRAFPDVIAVFWPEISPMINFDQKNKHHCYDVWEHTLHAMEALDSFSTPFQYDMALRLALFLHDIGKPATCTTAPDGQRHFYGHPAKSREIADIMLKRLRCPNLLRKQTLDLIEQHDRPIPLTEREIRRLLKKMEPENVKRLFDLKRADNLAQSPEYRERQAQLDQAVILLQQVLDKPACFSLKQLAVNGIDMQNLGLRGPAIGAALRVLLERVIDGDLSNNHDELVNFARENLR